MSFKKNLKYGKFSYSVNPRAIIMISVPVTATMRSESEE